MRTTGRTDLRWASTVKHTCSISTSFSPSPRAMRFCGSTPSSCSSLLTPEPFDAPGGKTCSHSAAFAHVWDGALALERCRVVSLDPNYLSARWVCIWDARCRSAEMCRESLMQPRLGLRTKQLYKQGHYGAVDPRHTSSMPGRAVVSVALSSRAAMARGRTSLRCSSVVMKISFWKVPPSSRKPWRGPTLSGVGSP